MKVLFLFCLLTFGVSAQVSISGNYAQELSHAEGQFFKASKDQLYVNDRYSVRLEKQSKMQKIKWVVEPTLLNLRAHVIQNYDEVVRYHHSVVWEFDNVYQSKINLNYLGLKLGASYTVFDPPISPSLNYKLILSPYYQFEMLISHKESDHHTSYWRQSPDGNTVSYTSTEPFTTVNTNSYIHQLGLEFRNRFEQPTYFIDIFGSIGGSFNYRTQLAQEYDGYKENGLASIQLGVGLGYKF